MAENVTGKKMSQYTPLDANDTEYFFGEGEGAVVTVGETSASSGKVNRLVKLSDIGGGGGGGSNIPELPDDAATRDYVLGIKDGKLDWVELDVYVSGSTYNVHYV